MFNTFRRSPLQNVKAQGFLSRLEMPLHTPANVESPILSQFSLRGKVAAVTGGAGGIGVEIVRALAEAGANVALIYASSTVADEKAHEIAASTGVSINTYRSDVRSRSAISSTLNRVVQDFGGHLDIVVANSGVSADIPCLDYTEETWASNNTVNLDGVMWTAQAAGKIFKKKQRGNLIITASVSATLVDVPQNQAAYNASKAGAVHLGKSLAVEWVDLARVNIVSPGFIETDSKCTIHYDYHRADHDLVVFKQPKERFDQWMKMVPARRMAKAAELKGVSIQQRAFSDTVIDHSQQIYVFLSSDACSYMTGANIIIDGGYTLT